MEYSHIQYLVIKTVFRKYVIRYILLFIQRSMLNIIANISTMYVILKNKRQLIDSLPLDKYRNN